jgi:hypothetical protein
MVPKLDAATAIPDAARPPAHVDRIRTGAAPLVAKGRDMQENPLRRPSGGQTEGRTFVIPGEPHANVPASKMAWIGRQCVEACPTVRRNLVDRWQIS